VSLGDALECRLAGGAAPADRGLDAVVDWQPEVARLLDGATRVRGNQEERIAAHLARQDVPDGMRSLLDAPLVHADGWVTACHGHELTWHELEPDLWCPTGTPADVPVLVFGHHHRSALYEITPDGVRSVDVTSGVPVGLDPARRYLVNVGPAQTATPASVVLDDEERTVTFRFTHRRHRKQVA
jgi:hypothetical protein